MPLDLNINNYTDNELFELLGFDLNEEITHDELNSSLAENIENYKEESPQLIGFFQEIRQRFNKEAFKTQSTTNNAKIIEKNLQKGGANTLSSAEGAASITLEQRLSNPGYRYSRLKDIHTPSIRKFLKGEKKYIGKSADEIDELYDEEYIDTHTENTNKEPETSSIKKTNNNRNIIDQDYLNVQNTVSLPYKQGILNPTLKTTVKRLLNIDSKFRPFPDGNVALFPNIGCSTNYNVNLSESLKGVQSLTLYSFEIPNAWNVINSHKNNNNLIVEMVWSKGAPGPVIPPPLTSLIERFYCVTIPSGNPTLADIAFALAYPQGGTSISGHDILPWSSQDLDPIPVPPGVIWDPPPAMTQDRFIILSLDKNGYIQLSINKEIWGGTWTNNMSSDLLDPPLTGSKLIAIKIHFWKESSFSILSSGRINCNTGDCSSKNSINNKSIKYQNTLGWHLGYRTPSIEFANPHILEKSCQVNTAAAWSIWAPPAFKTPIKHDYIEYIEGAPTSPPVYICTNGIPYQTVSSIGSSPPLLDWLTKFFTYISTWDALDDSNYLYIVLDDFNKNSNNKAIVNTVPLATSLDLPSYANNIKTTLPGVEGFAQAAAEKECDATHLDNPLLGSMGNGTDAKCDPQVGVFEFPVGLTQKQLYSVAQIRTQQQTRSTYSISNAATNDNIIARINTKLNHVSTPNQNNAYISGFGSNLSINKRTYFGPVDISRLSIQLIDAFGDLVDINNRDWCFTLQVDQLYQY